MDGIYIFYGLLIAVVIFLIERDKSKRAQQAAQNPTNINTQQQPQAPAVNGTVAPQVNAVQPQEHKSGNGLFVLLYFGCAMILGAIAFFAINTSEALIAPTIIMLSLLLILGGCTLYKSVDYLKPVAQAFALTGVLTLPFWYFALTSMQLTSDISLFLSCLITMLALYGIALFFNMALFGIISYIWTYFTIFSFSALFSSGLSSSPIATYILVILSSAFSAAISIAWYQRATWLPVPFRAATRAFAAFTTPFILFCLSIATLSRISNPYSYTNTEPFIATIGALIASAQYIYGWKHRPEKKHLFSAMRFVIYLTIILFTLETLSPRLGYNYRFNNSTFNTANVISAAIIYVASVFQLAYSIFARRKEGEEKLDGAEKALMISAVVGLIFAGLFFQNFDAITQCLARIFTYITAGIFGAGLAVRQKNANWLLLPILLSIVVPLEIGYGIANPNWGGWAFFAAYSILGLIMVAVYAAIRKWDEKNTKMVLFVGIAVSIFALVIASTVVDNAALGWLVGAILIAAWAYLTGDSNNYELVIYGATLSLFAAVNQSFNLSGNVDPNSTLALRSAVSAHILAFGPLAAGVWKERHLPPHKVPGRISCAYLILTLILLGVSWTTALDAQHGATNGYALILLTEQVLFLIFAVASRREWLMWGSIITTLLILVYLFQGNGWIMMFILGAALVGIVVWQLGKKNRRESIDETPAIASITTEDYTAAPTETPSETPAPEPAAEPEAAKDEPKTESTSRPSRLGGKPHSAKYN